MELERPAVSTTLDSLSSELILLILSNFCLHCREGPHQTPHAFVPDRPSPYVSDVPALRSMSLVSRRYAPFAQEILYHEFIPGYGNAWSATGHEEDSLLPFLRTVALDTNRAALVKRVHANLNLLYYIDEVPVWAEEVLKDAAQVHHFDISDFLAPFRDSRGPFSPESYQLAGDEVLGVLLACLPNLKSLSLTAGAPVFGIPASALKAAGVSALPLETLDITCCDKDLGGRLDGILELASQTIRSLFIDLCDRDGLGSLTRCGPFPNLRNLCIANSRLSGSELASFMSHYIGLETFSYESVLQLDGLFLSDVVPHLIRNKDTLQTLHLDVSPRQQSSDEDMETRRSPAELLANLNSFPVLRNLLLSFKLLCPSAGESAAKDGSVLTRLLPPSLVSLQVLAADDSMGLPVCPHLASGFLGLARAVLQGQFPNLRSVSCIARQNLDDYGLDAMFADAGVAFGYDGWQFNDGMPGRRARPRLGSTLMSSDDEAEY